MKAIATLVAVMAVAAVIFVSLYFGGQVTPKSGVPYPSVISTPQ